MRIGRRGRAAGLLGLSACFAAGLLAAAALGGFERRGSDSRAIVIGRSIGDVALGMSEADVVAAYGAPAERLPVVAAGGGVGELVHYRSHGGRLSVTFGADRRVAGIETTSPYYRTAGGVGVGRPIAGAAQLSGFLEDFCSAGYWDGASGRGAAVTVFARTQDAVASVSIAVPGASTACASQIDLPPEPPITAATFSLSVSIEPSGSGWVRSAPYLIDCPVACVNPVDAGTKVTLQARPTAGFRFEGWSGDCGGSGLCQVTLDGPRSVTARFSGSATPTPTSTFPTTTDEDG